MIVSQNVFYWICTAMIAGLAGAWLVNDLVRLRRLLPRRHAAPDEFFGSLIGVTIAVLGLIGVFRFHWGG